MPSVLTASTRSRISGVLLTVAAPAVATTRKRYGAPSGKLLAVQLKAWRPAVCAPRSSVSTTRPAGLSSKTLQLINYGEKYESRTPKFLRSAIKSFATAVGGKLTRTFLTRECDIENLFLDNFAIFGISAQKNLFSAETKARIGEKNPYFYQNQLLGHADAIEVLDKLLYVDSKTYLHELLMKQDQMSMAASIESRVPFLDHELVEFTARMPVNMKLRGKTTKFLLKEAMKGILPDEILHRPKMGFPVPMEKWLSTEFKYLIDEYVLSERVLNRGIFNASLIREFVANQKYGQDWANRIFRLINFEIWQRLFIDGEV